MFCFQRNKNITKVIITTTNKKIIQNYNKQETKLTKKNCTRRRRTRRRTRRRKCAEAWFFPLHDVFFVLLFGLKIYGWNKQHSFKRAWGCLFIRETMFEGWRPGTKWPKWPHSIHSFNQSLEILVKSKLLWKTRKIKPQNKAGLRTINL